MKKQITIMQVLPSLNQGGVERGAIDLALYLDKHNCKSIVVSNGGSWLYQLEDSNVIHIKMNVKTKNPFKMWLNSFKIKRLIKEHNVDIVHARSRAPAWSCYWATKSTKTKFITTFHGAGNLPSNPILRFFKKYYNSIMCTSIPTITPSQYTADFLVKNYNVNPCNLKVIYRWVDLKKYNQKNRDIKETESYKKYFNIPKNAKVIICPSRFSRIKGSHILIRALSLIDDNFYCIINVGNSKNDEFLNEVKKLIIDLKMEKKVFLNFEKSSKPEYLFQFGYISVNLATTEETFGRTIVESLAEGVPVICTNIGGPCEIIEENKSGWFIKPNDEKGLAETLQKALNLSAPTYKKMQENCKQRAKYFSLEEKCEQTLLLYKELLSKKGWEKEC